MKKKPRSPSNLSDEERAKRKAKTATERALNADIDAGIAWNIERIKAEDIAYRVVSAMAAEVAKKHDWPQGSVNQRIGRRCARQ